MANDEPKPLPVIQADRDAAADIWRDYVSKTAECPTAKGIRAGKADLTELPQRLAAHRIAHTRQLEADNAKLREALEQVTNDLEAEIEARRGTVLDRTMERDLITVRDARTALQETAR